MSDQPWFKLYASDYLLDSKLDSLCLEARAILVAMWCVCWIDGSCPFDSEEIARKTRLSLRSIEAHKAQLLNFFQQSEGRLYSLRMEEEKQKSEIARRNGTKRGEQIRLAKRSADCLADCSAQNQNQNQNQNQSQAHSSLSPSKEVVSLKTQKKEYSQTDFDARDLRRLSEALNKISANASASVGAASQRTWEQDFAVACAIAGISVARGLEVQDRASNWPTREASA